MIASPLGVLLVGLITNPDYFLFNLYAKKLNRISSLIPTDNARFYPFVPYFVAAPFCMKKPLYIETILAAPLDAVWEHTQNPALHQRWDLRFSEIDYLPKTAPDAPQQFRYATKIGFGLAVTGTGESVATKTTGAGSSTSVLKFWSASPISLIREGAGYWKYQPQPDGRVRFWTGYDYEPRWGRLGKLIDSLIFRPLMIWATAWSFDRLRLWLDRGILPETALCAQLTVFLASLALALVWIYQGLVPKILFPDSGELTILAGAGIAANQARTLLTAVGVAEIGFGLLLLVRPLSRWLHGLNIAGLLVLGAGALFSDASVFILPFNPVAVNLPMIALSVIALLWLDSVPRASRCITKPTR